MWEKDSRDRKGLPEKNNKQEAKPSVPQSWSYQYTREHGTYTGVYTYTYTCMKCAYVENKYTRFICPNECPTVCDHSRPEDTTRA